MRISGTVNVPKVTRLLLFWKVIARAAQAGMSNRAGLIYHPIKRPSAREPLAVAPFG